MLVEIIEAKISPATVEKLRSDVAALKQESFDRQLMLMRLEQKVEQIEKQLKPD